MVTTVPGITVVAVDEKGYCYLIREYGYALNRVTLKLPAGAIDAGETPLGTAKRECLEEVGLKSRKWHFLGRVNYYSMTLNTAEYLFLAKDTEEIPHARAEEDKKLLQIRRIPFSQVVRFALSGKIIHAESIAAILRADYYLKNKKYARSKKRSRN